MALQPEYKSRTRAMFLLLPVAVPCQQASLVNGLLSGGFFGPW